MKHQNRAAVALQVPRYGARRPRGRRRREHLAQVTGGGP